MVCCEDARDEVGKIVEDVKRRGLELIRKRLESVKDLLDLIDVDRVMKSVREDRESS
jgi:tetrahydromethanopterin S-methyltransferase subunit A